jgi:hypothetical protein
LYGCDDAITQNTVLRGSISPRSATMPCGVFFSLVPGIQVLMKRIGNMVWQAARRNQRLLSHVMLIIMLTAWCGYGMALLHHAIEDAPVPVCEQHLYGHDELISNNAHALSALTSITDTGKHYPQQDRLVIKPLYASIFHPPKAELLYV